MKKLITTLCAGVLALQVVWAEQAFAQAAAPQVQAEIEAQMKEARKALDEAARRLAELHTTKYGGHGVAKRAMLGILLGDGPMRGGVEMVGVTPGGGAEQAGLQAGDKIIRIADIDLGEVDRPGRELSLYMKQVTPGESVPVVYERKGEEVDAVIVTQAQSSHMMKMVTSSLDNLDFDFDFKDMPQVSVHTAPATSDRLMYVEGDLAAYFDVDEGVVVIKAPADSDLKGGDVLLEVDGQSVESVADALVALGDVDGGDVRVKRKGRNLNVAVDADDFDQVVKEEIRVIRVKRAKGGDDQDVHVEVIND